MARLGGVLAIVVSALYGLLGLFGMLVGIATIVINRRDGDVVGYDELFDFAGAVLGILGLIVFLVAVWGITIGINVIQGDMWARVAGFITFGLLCLVSVSTLFGDNDTTTGAGNDNIAATVANASACGLIALLMLAGGRRREPG